MPEPTEQQRAAVAAEGNVLVMAGAGTGKTSTLVARVLDRVARATHPVSIDRILMVTYTDAAAAEMRRRLRERLEECLAATPHSEWLTEQLALLDTAPIGTFHSFCLRLVREHFHELGLDPQLTVLDEANSQRLAHEAADAVLEANLRESGAETEAVRDFIIGLLDHRVEDARDLILRTHTYASTLPEPEEWLRRQSAHWEAPEPTEWRTELIEEVQRSVAHWAEALLELPSDHPAAVRCRLALAEFRDRNTTTGIVALLDTIVAQEGKRARKGQKSTKLQHDLLKDLFAEAAFLRSLLPAGPGTADPLAEDWQRTRRRMSALLALTIQFCEEFARAKRELGAVDFQDLEQFTLRLLLPRHGRPALVPDAAQRYDLVFVDECQDINAAEDAILRAVSRKGDGANRFLVGDVKQSIYRFRLAAPHIFQGYARDWHAASAQGRVIPLTDNFRSTRGILDFVNALFTPLMRREVGGVDYDDEAALHPGPSKKPAAAAPLTEAGPCVEMHLRFTGGGEADDESEAGESDDDDSPAATGTELEARLVAARLRQLHEAATPVWDREIEAYRPAKWRDMAVLLRSMKNRAADFAREFRRAGVPLSANEGGFFDRLEISDLVSLLELLDNPLQDLPLLAVLRSPLAGVWAPDELAAIRMAARWEKKFWTALGRFHELGAAFLAQHSKNLPTAADPSPKPEGDEVFTHPGTAAAAAAAWPKVDRFLERFRRWRRLAQRGPVAPVLEAALDETGYEAWLGTQEHAETRLANVRQLLAVARRFDGSQRAGLLRFLAQLKSLEDADALTPASAGERDDAVRLLTIHKSKGLEFPIVAVAGLGTKINSGDLDRAPVVLDEDRGLCPLVVAPDGTRYPSLPLWRAQRHQRREMLGEELRLLYVATTRACERLLLFGTTSAKTAAERWLPPMDERLTPVRLLKAKCYLDWLGPLLPRLTGEASWHERQHGSGALLSWEIVTTDPAPPPTPVPTMTPSTGVESTAGAPWIYPHAAATREPAKVSVTGLRRRIAAESEEESGRRLWISTRPTPRRRPTDASSENVELTAAERGTAHHRFLELVDLSRTASGAELTSELARLRDSGKLSTAEAAAVDVQALARFWISGLGVDIRARPADVRRELPFTLRLAVADLRDLGLPAPGLDDSEFVVAQGVIDLAVVGSGEIWIVDFKTDDVAAGELPDRANAYTPQLAVYALAMERIFRRPVTRRWLHFFAVGQSVPLH